VGRSDGLLPAAGICRCGRSRCGERFLRYVARPWFLALSVVLIGVGFWQQHRAKQCALRGRLLGTVLLWAAVGIIIAMVLFPQEIGAFIADRLFGGWKQ